MNLEQIATKHKTAKVPHGFMPVYERMIGHLRDEDITLVEIGVANGASMKTWSEYFTKAKIIGLEKQVEWDEPIKRVTVIKCDAVSHKETKRAIEHYGMADIIIDDGSHIVGEQMAAIDNLWFSLKPGGWYVIEDLFALYDPEWNKSGERNIVDVVCERIKSILVGGGPIQEVHFFGRNNINGILFLRKRHEPYRIQPLSEFNL